MKAVRNTRRGTIHAYDDYLHKELGFPIIEVDDDGNEIQTEPAAPAKKARSKKDEQTEQTDLIEQTVQ